MTAPAQYLGLQPGFRHLPAIELYNLLAPVGEHPRGSTVSRQTLEKHGYTLPSRRRLRRRFRPLTATAA
jgi:hypothetical protein